MWGYTELSVRQAFAKSFVERQSAYKWARALMDESTPGKAEELKSSVSVVGESLDSEELEQLRETILTYFCRESRSDVTDLVLGTGAIPN